MQRFPHVSLEERSSNIQGMVESELWVFSQSQDGSQPLGLFIVGHPVDVARFRTSVIINKHFPIRTQLDIANPSFGCRYQDDTVLTLSRGDVDDARLR